MAELTILLRRDPRSGKQNILIKLDRDPDALPVEHEQLHRTLVEKLIGKGLNPDDLGEVIVEREPAAGPTGANEPQPEGERRKAGQGQ